MYQSFTRGCVTLRLNTLSTTLGKTYIYLIYQIIFLILKYLLYNKIILYIYISEEYCINNVKIST